MNATATLPPDVAAYLEQVRAALADVPPEERDEMLADLEISLLEGAADSLEPPEARLGPPALFAQELRAAAGLDALAPPPRGGAVLDRLASLAATPRAQAAAASARELAPVWWAARGYVAACALAVLSGFNWSEQWAMLPVRGHPLGGALLVLAGITASVWLGLRARRDGLRRRWLTALNVVVALLTLPIAAQALEGPEPQIVEVGIAPELVEGVAHNGEPVRNIYPYSRDGKLLLDVLLYDDQGRALEVGSRDPQQDPLRRYLLTRRGELVLNAFPIRYVEAGTSEVADPTAVAADIEVPKIKTPPLKRP